MLSRLLSRLFSIGMVFFLLGAVVDLIVQVRQKPISIINEPDRKMTIGQPGLNVRARKFNTGERHAPDTLVSFNVTDSNGRTITLGSVETSSHTYPVRKAMLDSICKTRKEKGDRLRIDTQIHVLQYRETGTAYTDGRFTEISSMEKLADGRVVRSTILTDEQNKQVGNIHRDTFSNMYDMHIRDIVGRPGKDYQVSQEGQLEETLVLKPAGTGQQVIFILYKLALYFFTAWLLYTLSLLFLHFYKREYFSFGNIRLLRYIGICLLAPQLLIAAFYWLLLHKIQPVGIFISSSGDVTQTAQYEFLPATDLTLILLGLGMLILSYIFKNGLLLKEDHDLNI